MDWNTSKLKDRFVPNPTRYWYSLQPFPRLACAVIFQYTLELLKQGVSPRLQPLGFRENWAALRGRLRLLRSLRLLLQPKPQLEQRQSSVLGSQTRDTGWSTHSPHLGQFSGRL